MVSRMSSGSSSTRPLAQRSLDDRGRHHVLRGLLQRSGQPQHLLRALAGGRLDGDQARAADGQRARLVEDDGAGAGERLQRSAALDEDALARRLRDAGDEGHGRRQDERAGRRRHQHRQRPDGSPDSSQAAPATSKRDRQEEQGVAVGQADERRLRGLRRGDQAHDAGVGALARGGGGAHLEGLARIERAAARGLALAAVDRDRLSRQRRLVEHGAGARDHAVDGHDLAGAHHDCVADRHGIDGDVSGSVCADAVRDPAERGRPAT